MRGIRVLCAALVLLIFAVAPAIAVDDFQVIYRHSDVTTDGLTRTGYVILNIFNDTGESVRDLEAWIDGEDHVTYDNHRVLIGDLQDGQQIEVLAPFTVSEEPVEPAPLASWAVWTLEYTDASGKRVSVRVYGQAVQ